jgi:hypothetical protein
MMFTAWAISTGGWGLAGVYRFNSGDPLRDWQDGCRIALFRTREKAREHLSTIKGLQSQGKYPRARVVRVRVNISYELNEREMQITLGRFKEKRTKGIR